MSILSYIFDNEWLQRNDINSLRDRLQTNVRYIAAKNAGDSIRIKELENDVGELALLARTLFVYIKSQPGFNKEEFYKIFNDIDLMDGVKDGKVTKKSRKTLVNNRLSNCLTSR
jgi:hypothetical protein